MIKLTDIVYYGNGFVATFDDNSVANTQFKVVDGKLVTLGLSPEQKAAVDAFNDTSINTSDPRFQGITETTAASTGPLLETTVTITSPEILALLTTPKMLIAAPGAGKYLILAHVTAFNDFGTVAYNSGGANFHIKYADASRTALFTVGVGAAWADNTVDAVVQPPISQQFSSGTPPNVPEINAPIIFHAENQAPTLGDGEWKFSILYQIIEFA